MDGWIGEQMDGWWMDAWTNGQMDLPEAPGLHFHCGWETPFFSYCFNKSSWIARHQWLTPIIIATQEANIRRILVQGQHRKVAHETTSSKLARAKWTADVAQVVEPLLCKPEALNSNPSPSPPKKARGLLCTHWHKSCALA
jgi:hypothetical protein